MPDNTHQYKPVLRRLSISVCPSKVFMFSVKGIRISNVCLLNPPPSSWKSNPKFQIRIKCGNETKSSTKSAAKKGDSDSARVIWNDPFTFAGDINNDSMLTFIVFRAHRLVPVKVGSSTQHIVDLLKTKRSCELDITKQCQLSFDIEELSDAVPEVVGEVSEAMKKLPNLEVAAEAANFITSAVQFYNDQEQTWSSFLLQFQVFMKVIDDVSEISPYAKIAWSILSVIPKTIIMQKNRDENVKQLYEKLKDIYDYITDAKRLPEFTTTQSKTLFVLVQQTVECAYFIREYSKRNTVKNMVKGVCGGTDDKIQKFNDKLDHLKNVLMNSVSLETSIVTLRVSKQLSEQRDLTLLEGMPYDPDAGFIPGKRCLPGTRQTLIDEILEWVNNDASSQVLVISGQAGTGKSAVAHSIAGLFREQNRLGSIFCFNRSYKDRLSFAFSTIAHDLADGDDVWRHQLVKVIEQAAVRKSKDPGLQFRELILKPSNEVSTIGPVVIVIDALDEIGDRKERKEILSLIFDGFSELPKNYRVIVTSRPEQDIELQCQDSNVVYKQMGDISAEETRSDIQTYITSCLAPVSSILDKIDRNWCSILVKCAEGLFQWAQTACQFIDPTIKRSRIIKEKWETCVSGSSSSLYGLYSQIILSQSESRSAAFINEFKTIVGAIMAAREPLSINALQDMFQDIEDIDTILSPFGSLFIGVHGSSTPVRPLHTSLFDFFMATESSEYHIDTSNQSTITIACLALMNRMLCFNICQLETSHLPNRKVPDFDSRVKTAIPSQLSYSCRFWAFHLQSSVRSVGLVREIRSLMDCNLLYLFEILSLLSEVDEGCVAMRRLANWCTDVDKDLVADAMDAWQFGYDFGDVIMESTPHLYLSALPFTPRDSFISKQYLSAYSGLFTFDIGEPVHSSRNIGIMRRYTSGHPTALAFSPKDKYLATGSSRGEFWVWNYVTGELVYQYWADDYAPICDIVFSPNGELVYCCFRTGNILVWNIKTDEDYLWLYENTIGDEYLFFTISPDGCLIALWTKNNGCLYDRENDRILKQFERDGDSNHESLALFSPNGNLVIFFGDFDVWIWDIRKQAMVLDEIAFRTDFALTNSCIAFVGRSGTKVEIWDVRTSAKVTEIGDETHIEHFRFSPDSQYIISSHSTIYSIWDISTGELISRSSLDYHIHYSIFSHDSTSIALGTLDGAISVRQWDISVQQDGVRAGNDDSVPSQLFLRGRYLILHYTGVYHDGSIQVWDTTTMSTIVFETEFYGRWIHGDGVTSYIDEEHTYIAYQVKRGLCLWDSVQGEIILEPGRLNSWWHARPKLTSSDKYLISGTQEGFKTWDIRTRSLINAPCEAGSYYDISQVFLSANGDKFFLITNNYGTIEIRERESGRILGGPFKPDDNVYLVAFSANETHIVCVTFLGIDILDASTGAMIKSIPFIEVNFHHLSYQLSSNHKYLAWLDDGKLKLFDMDTETLLDGPPLRREVEMFRFSVDSRYILTLSRTGYSILTTHLCFWDIQDKKMTVKPILIASKPSEIWAVDFSNGRLGLSVGSLSMNYRSIAIWDLNAYEKMSALYFPRLDTSQLPVDGPEVERTEVLDYALRAWKKASLPAFAAMANGWVLGLHHELLLWVPNKRRDGFWYPCVMHVPRRDVTKLNFDNFVHGTRWTDTKG